MHLTQGSRKRVGTDSTRNLQKWRHAHIGQVRVAEYCQELGADPLSQRSGILTVRGDMWQSSTVQHFLPIRAEMKR